MALTNVTRGPNAEKWTITADSLPGGGVGVLVTTQIAVPADAQGAFTRALQRCRAIYKETGVVGVPNVAHPVISLGGLIGADRAVVVTLANNGDAASRSTGELEVWFEQSLSVGVDTYDGAQVGFSFTVKFGGTPTAPTGDIDIYLDVTLGAAADGRVGDSFVVGHPIGTWGEAARRVLAVLRATSGQNFDVTVYVDASGPVPAADVVMDPELVGSTRFHVVHPVSRWTAGLAGDTVAAASIVAELGSGLAVVPIVGPVVPIATHRGLFLELTATEIADPTHVETIRPMIVGVDVAGAAYTVGMLLADVPAIFNNVLYTVTARLRLPVHVVDGQFVFAPKAAQTVMSIAGVVARPNVAFGIRANHLIFGGSAVQAIGCQAWSSGVASPDGTIVYTSPTGVVGGYYRLVVGPDTYGITDAKAELWGVFDVLAASNGLTMGNAAETLAVGSGYAYTPSYPGGNLFMGSLEEDYMAAGSCGLSLSQYRARCGRAAQGAQVYSRNSRIRGTATVGAFEAANPGSYFFAEDAYLEELAGGPETLAKAENGGTFQCDTKTTFSYETVVALNFPLVTFAADNGKLELGKIVDGWKGQAGIVLAEENSFVEINGDILFTTANPGGGPDFLIDNSRVSLDGAYHKEVANTVASEGWYLRNGAVVTSDNANNTFTHGDSPADWGASYGNGWLYLNMGSKMMVAADIHDVWVAGVGAGIAIHVRRGSQLWCGAGSALHAVTATKVGVLAAGAFPTGAMLNDLPAAPAGTEELAIIGIYAAP